MTSTVRDAPPRIDGYDLDETIGFGGSATVYRAYQRSTDRFVAIKVLRARDNMVGGTFHGFERESRILGKLRHPNTVRLFDAGSTADGTLYFIQELLLGRSLEDVIFEQKLPI